jgi:outer membrane protein
MKLSGMLVGMVLFLPGFVHAQDLLDIYDLAVQNDPVTRAAQYDFGATEEGVNQAVAGLLPTATAEGDRTYNNQNIIQSQNPVFGVGSQTFRNDEYNITITQPVFNWAAWKRLSQAEASVKQASANNIVAQQDLILRVASAYLNVLAANDSIRFAEAEKESITRGLELAEIKLKQGLGTITGYYDAKARLTLNEAKLVESQNKLDDAKQALQEIIKIGIDEYGSLLDEIPLVKPDEESVDKWVSTAEAQSYSVEAKRQALEVAREEISKQQAGHLPTVDLIGSHSRKDTGSTLYGGGSDIETDYAMLKLSVPLFQGGAVVSRIREATLRKQKAQEELEQEIRKIERQARSSYLGITTSISKIHSLQDSLTFQKSALDAKEAGYKSGVNSMIAVLDAQRDLYAVRREHAQSRYDYLINRLRLKQATGTLGTDDLLAINNLLVFGKAESK